jgi:hypothetical protein
LWDLKIILEPVASVLTIMESTYVECFCGCYTANIIAHQLVDHLEIQLKCRYCAKIGTTLKEMGLHQRVYHPYGRQWPQVIIPGLHVLPWWEQEYHRREIIQALIGQIGKYQMIWAII